MMVLVRVAALAALIAVCHCIPVSDLTAQSKRPDPCVARLGQTVRTQDCTPTATTNRVPPIAAGQPTWDPASDQLPADSVALLVPSVRYATTANVATYPAGAAYTISFTSISTKDIAAYTFRLGSATSCAVTAPGTAAIASAGVAQNPAVAGATPFKTINLQLNAAWTSAALEMETAPRQLCVSDDGANFYYSGLKWKVVWSCVAESASVTLDNQKCKNWLTDYNNRAAADQTLTTEARSTRAGQLTCCTGTNAAVAGPVQILVGQCINNKIQSCCGSTKYSTYQEICCNTVDEAISDRGFNNEIPKPCPCRTVGGTSANQQLCPTGQQCCLQSQFSELVPATAAQGDAQTQVVAGQCYDPSSHKCCETGDVYDPGQSQCCPLSGVQSFTLGACPCRTNAHCPLLRSSSSIRGLCCTQTAPALQESAQSNIYQNYPIRRTTGAGRDDTASTKLPAPGNCIDQRYQTCCNGNTCRKEYEKCCNATCCNKFTGTCTEGFISGAGGLTRTGRAAEPNNWLEYRVKYDTCTEIEQLDTVKSFWIFVLPTVLLVASLTALALVLVFANKSTGRAFSLIERSLVVVSVLALFTALPTFFSPVYKYGVVVVLIALFTIITAAAPVKALNIADIILIVVGLVYLFDPFFGNAFLTLASDRRLDGLEEQATSGIIHATNRLWRERSQPNLVANVGAPLANVPGPSYCQAWYNYFRFDPALQDEDRIDNNNPETTDTWAVGETRSFGYCSRSWITALEFFEGFLLVFVLLLFVLALVAAILRFKTESSYDPIELEVQPGVLLPQQ